MHANVLPRLLLVLHYAAYVSSIPHRTVFGYDSEPISLTCDLQEEYRHLPFAWRDKVYNLGSEPNTIYNSTNGSIYEDYAKRGFEVSERTLKVRDPEHDVSGSYFCEIYLANGTVVTVSYDVQKISKTNCTKDLETKEGEAVLLECGYESSFSSTPYWTDGKEIIADFEHQSEFSVNQMNATFHATSSHNGATFKCMLENAEICSLKITVKYGVKEIIFLDTSKNFHPGENITCHASGNPIPTVTLALEANEYPKVSGFGQASLAVKEDLVGRKVKVTCEAWNEIDGVKSNVSKGYHLFVTEKPVKGETVGLADSNGLFIIIGIVIAIVLLVIILVIAIMVCNKKKGKKDTIRQKDDTLLKPQQKKDYNSDMI